MFAFSILSCFAYAAIPGQEEFWDIFRRVVGAKEGPYTG